MASCTIKKSYKTDGLAFTMFKRLLQPELFGWDETVKNYLGPEDYIQDKHINSKVSTLHPNYLKF